MFLIIEADTTPGSASGLGISTKGFGESLYVQFRGGDTPPKVRLADSEYVEFVNAIKAFYIILFSVLLVGE